MKKELYLEREMHTCKALLSYLPFECTSPVSSWEAVKTPNMLVLLRI